MVGIASDHESVAVLVRQVMPDVLLVGNIVNGNGSLTRLRALKKDIDLPLVIDGGSWTRNDESAGKFKDSGVDSLLPEGRDAKALAAALHLAKRNQAERRDMILQTEMLTEALQTRKLVGRATGLLMDHKGLERAQAVAFLEGLASESGIPLEEAAIKLIVEYDESIH